MDKIALFENSFLKKDIFKFEVGDEVEVHVKIVEEEKTRIQVFDGIVISRKGRGVNETFTVRRISYGEGVERIFNLHSPFIDKVVIVKKGQVRRAKLYYLRKKLGKKGKIEEKIEETAESTIAPGTDAQA